MKKHSIVLFGHATSFSLEEAFWIELKNIAKEQNVSVVQLIRQIDQTRKTNLSSALRVFVLETLQKYIQQINSQ